MEEKINYSWQTCQDKETMEDFSKLHRELVNKVIQFCKEHNIEVDEFSLTADGLRGSIPYGKWQAGSDSSFSLYDRFAEDPEAKPYLWSI